MVYGLADAASKRGANSDVVIHQHNSDQAWLPCKGACSMAVCNALTTIKQVQTTCKQAAADSCALACQQAHVNHACTQTMFMPATFQLKLPKVSDQCRAQAALSRVADT